MVVRISSEVSIVVKPILSVEENFRFGLGLVGELAAEAVIQRLSALPTIGTPSIAKIAAAARKQM